MGVRALPALAAVALIAGCGGDQPPPAQRHAARRSLCGELQSRVVGHVRGGNVSELSGLARTSDGRLWAIEDSGNSPTLIAMRGDGRVLGRPLVTGAQNVDWEDIAASGNTLFVADIGDNATTRQSIQVYRVPAPARGAKATAPAEAITLRYPDTPHDAEALIVHGDRLAIVTKGLLDGRLYSGPLRSGTLQRGPRVRFGLVTGAAVDRHEVLLRSYDALAVWPRRGREALAQTLAREPCISPTSLAGEGQGEAVALDAGARAILTAPEGRDPPLRRWTPR